MKNLEVVFGGDYFHKVESLLDFQHKFETETREKCQSIIKERNIKNTLTDIEDRLREYDEQISLDLLLKKNRDYIPWEKTEHTRKKLYL